MLLTTVELWVALDRLAVKEIPLLEKHSPEISTWILESLIIRTSLCRLQHALHTLEPFLDLPCSHKKYLKTCLQFATMTYPHI